MAWFRFMDMCSGGSSKTQWDYAYVEAANEREADAIFEEHTGRDPHHVTCDCCGADYSVTTFESLEQATAYDRGCDWRGTAWIERARPGYDLASLAEYAASPGVLVIPAPGPTRGDGHRPRREDREEAARAVSPPGLRPRRGEEGGGMRPPQLWVWHGSPDDTLDVLRYVSATTKDILAQPCVVAEREADRARIAELVAEVRSLRERLKDTTSALCES